MFAANYVVHFRQASHATNALGVLFDKTYLSYIDFATKCYGTAIQLIYSIDDIKRDLRFPNKYPYSI